MANIYSPLSSTLLALLWIIPSAHAQDGPFKRDTIHPLPEVTIQAFEERKPWLQQAAPIATLEHAQLHEFQQTSILPAVNALPGIRMEQRSPASYRLNIRGSSIRAPFGVREVKIYYNGIPLTSPGGDTYLNQLDITDFGQITFIKGPAASIYGAGIGGVMLIESPLQALDDSLSTAQLQYETGSYGLQHAIVQAHWGTPQHQEYAHYGYFTARGYREHTASWQHTASYESYWQPNDHHEASLWLHINDLWYQTPGGLTLSEMEKNPRMARPASGPYPSADSAHAAIAQQNFIIGVHTSVHYSRALTQSSSAYLSYSHITNPTFRNMEYRKEPHGGLRTVMQYNHQGNYGRLILTGGAEWQEGLFNIEDYGNRGGQPDTMQTHYNETIVQTTIFLQGDIQFSHGWSVTGGLSFQQTLYTFYQLYPTPYTVWHINPQSPIGNWSPRIALLKNFSTADMSIYLNIAKAFSPPTINQLLPSTNILNTHLRPQWGYNYEVGWKGYALQHRLRWESNIYLFNLQQSISQQRDSSGADYFINAGHTHQAGLETWLQYQLPKPIPSWLPQVQLSSGLTLTNYRYQDYAPLGHDYTGKRIPGVSPLTWVNQAKCQWSNGLQAFLQHHLSQAIPLNDANTAYSRAYNLIDLKIGYQHSLSTHQQWLIYLGVNNLLNQLYSLGDDVNAAGNRYYNPAPARNYYVGLQWQWK
ncbi:MAG: TonB-dependent receptor plug domain-containing protein [Thermoflavifilum sp.]|nr:TonB-dependent receptor plug domain-containing protein [Thermoflavifilum sp.]